MRCSDVIDAIVITRRDVGGIQNACKNLVNIRKFVCQCY